MSLLSEVVDQLFVQVKEPPFDPREIHTAVLNILQQVRGTTSADLDAALQRMQDLVASLPLLPASLIAVGCGALVEEGGSAKLVGQAILQRSFEALQRANTFVRSCQDMAHYQDDESDSSEAEKCIERYGQQISKHLPAEAEGWSALRWIFLAANTILQRDILARESARANKPLMAMLQVFPIQTSEIECLRELIQVLDNEELVVLHPGLQRGYRIRISGIAYNFQLHILLADALIGKPAKGWLPGKRPNPVVVAAAKDGPCPHTPEESSTFPTAQGAFNLWNWQGLQADGSLPVGTDQSHHWIWNEGTPADIATFEGTRVILIGPEPYPRTWNAGRYFPHMAGQLEVLEILTPAQAADWLARLAVTQK